MPEDDIAESLGDDASRQPFGIWRENKAVAEVFFALKTQWRIGALGGRLGLDYLAAEAVMRMLRVKNRARTFSDLRVMECAALNVFNRKEG